MNCVVRLLQYCKRRGTTSFCHKATENFVGGGNHKRRSRLLKLKRQQGSAEVDLQFSPPSVFKLTVFVAGFSGACYVGACIWHYERHKTAWKPKKHPWRFGNQPDAKAFEFRNDLNHVWEKLSNGTKTVIALTLLNAAVFLCWKAFPTHPLLNRYFLSGGHASKPAYANTVLCAFSHYSLTHLCLNLYVLWQVAPYVVQQLMGVEQFLGFYLAAAAVSSYASQVYKIMTTSKAVSLGASGAILATIMYCCQKMPNGRLHVVFLPQFQFSAESAVKGILAFETLCLLLLPAKWRKLDHAAHLGGCLFGLWYAKYGDALWNHYRLNVLRWWITLIGRR